MSRPLLGTRFLSVSRAPCRLTISDALIRRNKALSLRRHGTLSQQIEAPGPSRPSFSLDYKTQGHHGKLAGSNNEATAAATTSANKATAIEGALSLQDGRAIDTPDEQNLNHSNMLLPRIRKFVYREGQAVAKRDEKRRKGTSPKAVDFPSQHRGKPVHTTGPKWVHLQRRGPSATLDLFSREWTTAFALLSSRYERDSESTNACIQISDESEASIAALLSGGSNLTAITEAWARQPESVRAEKWGKIMMAMLQSRPDVAHQFLRASYDGETLPPPAQVADALEYIFYYHLKAKERPTLEVVAEMRNLLDHILARSSQQHPDISQRTLYLLLGHLSGSEIRDLHESLLRNSVYIHPNTQLHFVVKLANFGELEASYKALKVFLEMRVKHIACLSTCTHLLNCIGESRQDAWLIKATLSDMIRNQVEPNTTIFNVMIRNAVHAGRTKTGWDLYHQLQSRGLEADSYTYSILLNDAKLRGDFVAIERIDDALKSRPIVHDAHITGDMLLAIFSHDSGNGAHSTSPWGKMLNFYARHFALKPLEELGIPTRGIQGSAISETVPPPFTLALMLGSYISSCEDPDQLFHLYSRFRSLISSKHPLILPLAQSDYTYNAFMLAFQQTDRGLEFCPKIISDMLTQPEPSTVDSAVPIQGVLPTTRTWTILMQTYSSYGRTRAAKRVLELMDKHGARPDQRTWNTLIRSYVLVQDLDGAVRRFREMKLDGWNGDDDTFKSLGRLRDRAGLLERMKELEGLDG